MAKKGFFVVFEGIDGSGKTTQAYALSSNLRRLGYSVVQTVEPGGTNFGASMRSIILDGKFGTILPRTSDFLFLADRIQHIGEVIAPALEAGKVVICDRYRWSTEAYIAARGESREYTSMIAALQKQLFIPADLTILMECITPEESLIRKPKGERNRFDNMDLDFHRKVREEYGRIAVTSGDDWAMINAARSRKEVEVIILESVIEVMKYKK